MGRSVEKASGGRLVIIDGANTLFRAFFGIPHLRAPDGTPTNAALGFMNILNQTIRDEAPTFVIVAFDPPGGSFRNEIYADYKAGRDEMPEDLSVQFPIVRELIEAHAIPLIEMPGFEADDVIASLVEQTPPEMRISIISTDKDLLQLCSDRVELVDGIKGKRFGPAEVEEKFGVAPDRMLDLRALVGDPSDNIPGVKGIGLKGAAKLIAEYETLENLLDHAQEVKAKRAREGLTEYAEEARLSKQLSALRRDLELPIDPKCAVRAEPDRERLLELYRRLGFTRHLEALEASDSSSSESEEKSDADDALPIEVLVSLSRLEAVVAGLRESPGISIQLIADEGSVVDAAIRGIALSGEGEEAFYVPIADDRDGQSDLPMGDSAGLPLDAVVDALTLLLQGASARPWTGFGGKRIQALLVEAGLEIGSPAFDLEIASFLLDPAGTHGLGNLSMALLERTVRSWEDLAGRGARAKAPIDFTAEELAGWSAEQIRVMPQLRESLRERLEKDGLSDLFLDVELPLTGVLARVERNGVRIDEEQLASLSREYESSLASLEKQIHLLAGERFLVSSPKQLQVILFDKLKLPPLKKTKTGYSTAESVLEQLSTHHELPARVLEWRRLSKLKSTYVDALPRLVSEKTGRIHPNFNPIGAATGRLSASDPNVQNIPIRTEEGIRIREAFIPAEGKLMLSADYSQVELRILAHFSGDESLLEAFAKGEDVHRRTAAEVAGISVEDVSDEERARAKAVNFGIIYGSTAFGLANNLGIATAEAQEIVDAYFARYIGVRRFIDDTIADAKQRGHVVTLLGRRRYLPDLVSRNRVLRQAAERMAVNSVIQGTAADLIKKAMVDVDAGLAGHGLHAEMILQVHDELVFEVPEAEVDALTEFLHERMGGVFALRVPLLIDVGVGSNWREAH